ncbi:MAG: alpha/beta hydrolase [Rhizomicrobium sp.]|nr:alpha/beta hydrolase [Rhizomicrobium sp.]
MPVHASSRLLSAGLDPFAARVIERLSRSGYAPSQDVDAIRRHYTVARTPLLAVEEEMASIEYIAGHPSLIILRPQADTGLRPAVVFFHGGGWVLGGFDTYGPLARQLAHSTGRVVVFVDYRLAPEHPFPAAIEDAFAALEWVTANAAALGIDKTQIAVGGDSAGGNLAAVAALAARDGLIEAAPQFQLLIYPCLDLTASQPSHAELASGYLLTREIYAWYRGLYVGAAGDLSDWRLSPLAAPSLRDVAPAIALYAGFDPLRDEALLYCSRLVDAGVAVEPIFYPGMIHGFMTMGGAIPAANDAVWRIATAIRKWEKYPRISPALTRADAARAANL